MTVQIDIVPGSSLTLDDYLALPEESVQRWELLEGYLVMAPSPTFAHGRAAGRLFAQLDEQLPAQLTVGQDTDVDLQFDRATVRRPDVFVLERAEAERVGREGGLIRAEAVLLVVEIVSPGSRRTDLLIKPGEYADAGIEHYWVLDLDGPSLSVLNGDPEALGLRIDLDALS